MLEGLGRLPPAASVSVLEKGVFTLDPPGIPEDT